MKKSLAKLEAIAQNKTVYVPESPCAKGHKLRNISGTCIECRRIAEKIRYALDPKKTRERTKAKYEQNAEKLKLKRRIAYAANPEPEKAIAKIRSVEWRKQNPKHEGTIKSKKKWAKNNLGKVRAYVVKRRTAKMHRTPAWLDKTQLAEIEFTYEYCAALRSIGLNYHVDHIVPLQGEIVSGFHVPWNLQVIHASDNIRKANRLLDDIEY